jgi:hypothetical protein
VKALKSLGTMFCTPQSSERVYLYTVNLTGVEQGEMQLEPSELAQGKHDNHWVRVTPEFVSECQDPRFVVAYQRMKVKMKTLWKE